MYEWQSMNLVCIIQIGIYLKERNDKRPQREVGGLVKFGVKLFNGESGVLLKTTICEEERKQKLETNFARAKL